MPRLTLLILLSALLISPYAADAGSASNRFDSNDIVIGGTTGSPDPNHHGHHGHHRPHHNQYQGDGSTTGSADEDRGAGGDGSGSTGGYHHHGHRGNHRGWGKGGMDNFHKFHKTQPSDDSNPNTYPTPGSPAASINAASDDEVNQLGEDVSQVDSTPIPAFSHHRTHGNGNGNGNGHHRNHNDTDTDTDMYGSTGTHSPKHHRGRRHGRHHRHRGDGSTGAASSQNQ